MPTDPTTLAYITGFFGMLFGLPPCFSLLAGDGRLGSDEGHFGILMVIPGFAALMYLCMAFGIGETTLQGYEVPLTRYIDWLVTTPVLVGYAAHVAGASRRAITSLAVADALMILFGTVAVWLAPPEQWAGFALSALCHLALLGALYGPVWQSVRSLPPARKRLARLLIGHVGLLWIAYPLVWVVGPGLQYISATALSVIIAYMDVVAKVPYVYFVYRASETIATEAAATGASTTGASATGASATGASITETGAGEAPERSALGTAQA